MKIRSATQSVLLENSESKYRLKEKVVGLTNTASSTLCDEQRSFIVPLPVHWPMQTPTSTTAWCGVPECTRWMYDSRLQDASSAHSHVSKTSMTRTPCSVDTLSSLIALARHRESVEHFWGETAEIYEKRGIVVETEETYSAELICPRKQDRDSNVSLDAN